MTQSELFDEMQAIHQAQEELKKKIYLKNKSVREKYENASKFINYGLVRNCSQNNRGTGLDEQISSFIDRYFS